VTAGGLVFIGATVDGKFRAFDSKTGKEVWVVDHSADGVSNPITYLGKDGKQYVSIYAAGGANKKKLVPGTVFVYSLP
jgi:quinoprotein glucose dehydrogenase